jgi:putative glutamine amidotransferase
VNKTTFPKPPLIGITPDVEAIQINLSQRRLALSLQDQYLEAVVNTGGIPWILPVTSARKILREILEHVGGILVTGGNFDIHPRFYGEAPLPVLKNIKDERTEFELRLIDLALKLDKPILGLCGGEQAINVALGGSLYQDIATQIPHALQHQQGNRKETGGHQIRVLRGTKLRRITGRASLEVNTTHHQAVKKLGRGLVISAVAEDGVVEGIESCRHSFVLGVQWHPESMIKRDLHAKKIYSAFVAACGRLPKQT